MSLNSPYLLTPTPKLFDGVTAAAEFPAPVPGEIGHHTRNHENLHLLVIPTGGTSMDLRMWVQFPGVDTWALYSAFGTAGVRQFTTATGAEYVVVPIEGIERVYFESDALVGGSWDVYLGANSKKNE